MNAAKNSSDYMGVSIDLIFTAGSMNGSMQCIDVAVHNTLTVEEDETFTVTLTALNSYVSLGNNVMTIVIMDNHSMYTQ